MSVGLLALVLAGVVVVAIVLVVCVAERADRDALEFRRLMARNRRVCDEREARRRMARSAIEDWRDAPDAERSVSGPWRVVERQRTNIWGTMVGVAPEATNGKESFCFGAAFPDFDDDFAERLDKLRAKAAEKCRVLNEVRALP